MLARSPVTFGAARRRSCRERWRAPPRSRRHAASWRARTDRTIASPVPLDAPTTTATPPAAPAPTAAAAAASPAAAEGPAAAPVPSRVSVSPITVAAADERMVSPTKLVLNALADANSAGRGPIPIGQYDLSLLDSAGAFGGGDGGAPAAAAAPDTRPLAVRLADKAPGVRRIAFAELAALFGAAGAPGGDAAVWSAYGGDVLQYAVAGETNALAQETAAAALAAFAAHAPHASEEAGSIVGALVERFLPSARRGTVSAAVAAAVSLASSPADAGATLGRLMSAFGNLKKPRVAAGAATAIEAVIDKCGAAKGDAEALLAALPAAVNSTDKVLSAAAVKLGGALARVAPGGVAALLSDARHGFSKAVHKALSDAVAARAPASAGGGGGTGAAAAVAATGGGAAGAGGRALSPVDETAEDTWPGLPAVDILPSVKRLDLDAAMAEAKWSMRAEALTRLLELCERQKRIAGSPDWADVMAFVKAGMKDSNVHIVNITIRICGALAARMRSPFTMYARQTLRIILEKLRVRAMPACMCGWRWWWWAACVCL